MTCGRRGVGDGNNKQNVHQVARYSDGLESGRYRLLVSSEKALRDCVAVLEDQVQFVQGSEQKMAHLLGRKSAQ